MYPVTYFRAQSVAEAVALLGANPEAMPLAGGMTLIPTLKQRLASPSHLVDLMRISALHGIAFESGVLRIGAATSHAVVAESPLVRKVIPALATLASLIGDAQIRHRGTIGGSIANNDPAADYPGAILGLNATIITDRREIPADDFFTGMFSTALAPDEIIVAVQFSQPHRAVYLKHRHPASGYAVVGVFLADTSAGARIALTGAAPCVMRWTAAEARLVAPEDWSSSNFEGLSLESYHLNDDLGATAAYRAHLAGVLLRRAIVQLADVSEPAGH
ncbi:xanthine dehydrogenase family protein subunit M [Limnohabitans sp. 15K]|uniref:FAD binding domain-containing protein n=1 Tax=Limnohabitans sp. 15K TaxID=1100706 RepID=UPI000C1E50A7|nr:xanthine dehydrogenase family protein subunit M [Limnohabitans sp. 15K]PIT82703.1 carbon monoxide dehydrogenase [Limnohabitans sp. 15K]